MIPCHWGCINTLGPRHYGRRFADGIFKRICFHVNDLISINITPKFVDKCQINDIPAMLQIMAWRRPGDKPLSETMMVNLPPCIYVTQPQWVIIIVWRVSNIIVVSQERQCALIQSYLDILLGRVFRLSSKRVSMLQIIFLPFVMEIHSLQVVSLANISYLSLYYQHRSLEYHGM